MASADVHAYIQGDWTASAVSGSVDEIISKNYNDFLDGARKMGVINEATWHIQAQGVGYKYPPSDKSVDVIRNCGEIGRSDTVITYLQRKDPPSKHWGSLSLISYAAGLGKPSILIAPADCVVWRHHFVYHPLITRMECDSITEAMTELAKILKKLP